MAFRFLQRHHLLWQREKKSAAAPLPLLGSLPLVLHVSAMMASEGTRTSVCGESSLCSTVPMHSIGKEIPWSRDFVCLWMWTGHTWNRGWAVAGANWACAESPSSWKSKWEQWKKLLWKKGNWFYTCFLVNADFNEAELNFVELKKDKERNGDRDRVRDAGGTIERWREV